MVEESPGAWARRTDVLGIPPKGPRIPPLRLGGPGENPDRRLHGRVHGGGLGPVDPQSDPGADPGGGTSPRGRVAERAGGILPPDLGVEVAAHRGCSWSARAGNGG